MAHGIGDGRHETERNHALIAGQVGPFDASWTGRAFILRGPIGSAADVICQDRHPRAVECLGDQALAGVALERLVDALHEEDREVLLMGGPRRRQAAWRPSPSGAAVGPT